MHQDAKHLERVSFHRGDENLISAVRGCPTRVVLTDSTVERTSVAAGKPAGQPNLGWQWVTQCIEHWAKLFSGLGKPFFTTCHFETPMVEKKMSRPIHSPGWVVPSA
jgi:hypothetical protein